MDITITIPDAQVSRVAKVVGMQLGLEDAQKKRRSATKAEVQGWIAGYVKGVVRSYELQEAQEQVVAGVTDISVG